MKGKLNLGINFSIYKVKIAFRWIRIPSGIERNYWITKNATVVPFKTRNISSYKLIELYSSKKLGYFEGLYILWFLGSA